MAILVTGGAGYIGGTFVAMLQAAGQAVVVLDNLSRGHRGAVPAGVPFVQGSVGDRELVKQVVREHQVDVCVHFAAFAYVGESVEKPALYYENNVMQGLNLLGALCEAGVKRFVFSSTCATYGEVKEVPIPESHPQWPSNPYGWTKFVMERALEQYDHAYGLKFVALRYFNACGALGAQGEHHDPEPHLIPLVLFTALGKRSHISVFGTDYPTPDGTAIRDYIHVADLGQAHLQALEYLRRGGQSEKINLGNGLGYSVLEVIAAAKQVTGREIPVQFGPRRAGDPSRLIAKADKARAILGWQPQYPKLETIIETAWRWHLDHPHGYEQG
jgi:UDP-glucose 4-epimerase